VHTNNERKGMRNKLTNISFRSVFPSYFLWLAKSNHITFEKMYNDKYNFLKDAIFELQCNLLYVVMHLIMVLAIELFSIND